MPITLSPLSRRRFLATSLATGAGLLLRPAFSFGAEVDPHRLALLSDVHIDADPTASDRGVVMFDHLQRTVAQVVRLEPKPVAALINGDCAHLHGRAEDYRVLIELLRPLRESGLPVHLSMGNHDNRENLWKTIPSSQSREGNLADRQIAIVEMPRANLFLLDSLKMTNFTPGLLGDAQVNWLGAALDARTDKPAVVIVHHQPDESLMPQGLTDTRALLAILTPRKHVKALFYGHTHHWEITSRAGIHCVNLPAVAYPFDDRQPTGWVDARVREDGINLELRCVDPTHPKHGQKVELTWRA
jgi:3',5'-cyclic AMP phosphodiesterase CpdA